MSLSRSVDMLVVKLHESGYNFFFDLETVCDLLVRYAYPFFGIPLYKYDLMLACCKVITDYNLVPVPLKCMSSLWYN